MNTEFNKDRTEKNFVQWFACVKIMDRAKIRRRRSESKFKRKRHMARTRAEWFNTYWKIPRRDEELARNWKGKIVGREERLEICPSTRVKRR
jgi:hypothetical protein